MKSNNDQHGLLRITGVLMTHEAVAGGAMGQQVVSMSTEHFKGCLEKL